MIPASNTIIVVPIGDSILLYFKEKAKQFQQMTKSKPPKNNSVNSLTIPASFIKGEIHPIIKLVPGGDLYLNSRWWS